MRFASGYWTWGLLAQLSLLGAPVPLGFSIERLRAKLGGVDSVEFRVADSGHYWATGARVIFSGLLMWLAGPAICVVGIWLLPYQPLPLRLLLALLFVLSPLAVAVLLPSAVARHVLFGDMSSLFDLGAARRLALQDGGYAQLVVMLWMPHSILVALTGSAVYWFWSPSPGGSLFEIQVFVGVFVCCSVLWCVYYLWASRCIGRWIRGGSLAEHTLAL